MNNVATYSFYLGLLLIAGAGEYVHLVPMGTLATLLGGVLGHGISEVSRQGAAKL